MCPWCGKIGRWQRKWPGGLERTKKFRRLDLVTISSLLVPAACQTHASTYSKKAVPTGSFLQSSLLRSIKNSLRHGGTHESRLVRRSRCVVSTAETIIPKNDTPLTRIHGTNECQWFYSSFNVSQNIFEFEVQKQLNQAISQLAFSLHSCWDRTKGVQFCFGSFLDPKTSLLHPNDLFISFNDLSSTTVTD